MPNYRELGLKLAKNLGKISELKNAIDSTFESSSSEFILRKYAIEYLGVLKNEK